MIEGGFVLAYHFTGNGSLEIENRFEYNDRKYSLNIYFEEKDIYNSYAFDHKMFMFADFSFVRFIDKGYNKGAIDIFKFMPAILYKNLSFSELVHNFRMRNSGLCNRQEYIHAEEYMKIILDFLNQISPKEIKIQSRKNVGL